jgi:hypothetical protein
VQEKWCESCLMSGKRVPATTRSINPDYAKYDLCEECAAKFDAMQEAENYQEPSPAPSYPRGGGGSSASFPGFGYHHREEIPVKMGGKHFKGCICPICGGLDGKHTHLCVCPVCGGKAGKHTPYCFCPQCSEKGGKHHPYCECPVCHRLG